MSSKPARNRSTWRLYLKRFGLMVGGALFLQQLVTGVRSLLQLDLPSLDLSYLFIAFLFTALAYLFQVIGWSRIMAGLGVQLKLEDALTQYYLVFLPRYIPGSIWGYVSRGEWLRERYGLSQATSALGSILEVAWLLLIGGLIISFYLGTTMGYELLSLIVVALGGLIGGWALLSGWQRIPWLRERFGGQILAGEINASRQTRPLAVWSIPAIYLSLWLSYGLSLNGIMSMFGLNIEPTQTLVGRVLEPTMQMALAWSVGFLVFFVPAGLGVRELTLTSLLSNTLSSPELAEALAVCTRVLILVVELCWIGSVLLAHRAADHLSEEKSDSEGNRG